MDSLPVEPGEAGTLVGSEGGGKVVREDVRESRAAGAPEGAARERGDGAGAVVEGRELGGRI